MEDISDVNVKRSSGEMESGWQVINVDKGSGQVLVTKKDKTGKEVLKK